MSGRLLAATLIRVLGWILVGMFAILGFYATIITWLFALFSGQPVFSSYFTGVVAAMIAGVLAYGAWVICCRLANRIEANE